VSGGGAARFSTDAQDMTIAVVAGSWHQAVMEGLISSAVRTCKSAGADVEIMRVPGAFELPIVAQECARSGRYQAVVALGVIIRGGTPHFEYVASAATQGLTRVALDSAVPVGFGLLTCDNEQQALDRSGLPDSVEDKGAEAAEAALATAALLAELRNP